MSAGALHVLVPTDLADDGAPVAAALDRLAAACELRVTAAHVVPEGGDEVAAGAALSAWLPGRVSSRLLLRGDDPVAEVSARCSARAVDLVLAPGRRPRRPWWRWLAPSARARWMATCGAPVWTFAADGPRGAGPLSTVAALVELGAKTPATAQLAASFARATGARLRLVTVVRPLDEGTLHDAEPGGRPLHSGEAVERLRTLGHELGAEDVGVDAAVGSVARQLRPLVEAAAADVVFVARGALPAWSGWAAAVLDDLPCPVVGVGDAPLVMDWAAVRSRPFAVGGLQREASACNASRSNRTTHPRRV
jgi:hypothetical protein